MHHDAPNAYGDAWFAAFGWTVDPVQTSRECAFLMRTIPRASHGSILDVCCGEGRHALQLAEAGYDVTGVDRHQPSIDRARRAESAAAFHVMDVGESLLSGQFDAVICMWASFGFGSDAQNRALLLRIAEAVRPEGLLIFDIYNAAFFEQRTGERTRRINDADVIERIEMTEARGERRLNITLQFADGAERFSWQVWTSDAFADFAAACGISTTLMCSAFTEGEPPRDDRPRMQVALTRPPVRR